MGWYLHEEFYSYISLPSTYEKAVCATCWHEAASKLTQKQLESEPRIYDLVTSKKYANSTHFISQEEFESSKHAGHVLAYVKLPQVGWLQWRPVFWCEDCKEWSDGEKRPICTRVSTKDHPCKMCLKNDYSSSRYWCSHEDPKKPKFLELSTGDEEFFKDIERVFCFGCEEFVSRKEARCAIRCGKLDCINTDDVTPRDLVHIFHFAKYHSDVRDYVNIAYEAGTCVREIRREYMRIAGRKSMRIKKKKVKRLDGNLSGNNDDKLTSKTTEAPAELVTNSL